MLRKQSIVLGILTGIGLAGCVGEAEDATDGQDSQAAQTRTRVWIELAPGGKAPVQAAVQSAGGQLHYDFDNLGALVATVPTAALNGLGANPNVLSIEEDAIRLPLALSPGEAPPYGVGMVEALTMQAAGFDGSGVDVCIIDSGLRVEGGSPTTSPVTYVDGNLPANQDGDGHGTHVAGTIAGEPYQIGVAPGVHLIIVRVFGDDGTWAYSSTLAHAADQCVAAGADVISMSLGGGARSKMEEKAFNAAASAGVLSIAAAGNDGNKRTSYPAGYASVVSVAAVDASKVKADFSQVNRDVELAAPGVNVWSSTSYLDVASVSAGGSTFEGSHIEFSARSAGVTGTLVDGGLCDAPASGFSGRVVLCARGTIAFNDKVQNAASSGAIGVVISNNVSGGFAGTLGDGNSSTIPAIGISLEDGDALRASALGTSVTVVASHDPSHNGFEAYSGTSMATPHVSGVAALVWSACPSATAAQVRSALATGAEDLGTAGRDTSYGHGLVRACRAAQALCNAPVTCP